MKPLLALSLLLVLLLAGCQALPPPFVAPPQAEPPPGRPQQEEPAPSATTMPEPPAPEQPDVHAALQGLLDDQVKSQHILGMAMAARLADGTEIFRSSGHTDPAGQNAWGLDTQSAVGSVTKTFVAVVIMQLVEEGKLSLDDTIDTWFPDQPNGDKITVRMLLSHTSGLAHYVPIGQERDPKWSNEWAPLDLVAEANRLGPVDEPGTPIAHYTNTNYFLLGLIIEAITGNTWEEEVRSRIIEPLDLQGTTFLNEAGVWGGTLVPGYTRTADGYLSNLEIPDLPSYSTAWAAGGMVSTMADLLTFTSALFDGELVSKETLAEMGTPLGTDMESGLQWGLGGATADGLPPGSFGMGGDAAGYHAFFIGVQGSKLLVVALVNTEEGDVVTPGLMALQYLSSLAPGGEEPAPEVANLAAEWLAGELGVAAEDLHLVGAEQVVWTDSCYGLGGPAESCLRADIPGWRFTFEAEGQQYEVRSDEAGSAFRLAPQES